jgi:argininosuccinate lyase
MKLWDKEISTEQRILSFTTGKDPVYDLDLAPYDVAASMAHAVMLAETGLIASEKAGRLVEHLHGLYQEALGGKVEAGSRD